MPDFSNVQLFQWLVNNGVAVAFLFLVMFGIGKQITEATKYFTSKLDDISTQNTQAVGELTKAINNLAVNSAQNNEALKLMMIFLSQNMQQIVSHRNIVEGTGSEKNIAGPNIESPKEAQTTNGGKQSTSDTTQNKP